MSAVFIDGTESDFRLPTLAQRVQDMSKGAGGWTQVAEAALEEFVAPLRVLGFAALERVALDEPFATVLSHQVPMLKVGKSGPRSTIGSFVDAAAKPGQVVLADLAVADEAAAGTVPWVMACAVLPADRGPQHLIVLAGRTTTVTRTLLVRFTNQLLDLLRPAVGGAMGREPADAISIAIRHAKREWETVADGLPAMVGLADARGRVLRVNRSMSRVPGKELGRSIHSLLHGSGCATQCGFAKTLQSALELLPNRRKVMIKTRSKEKASVRNVYLRYIPGDEPRNARIVFSITAVPEAPVPAATEGTQARLQREQAALLEHHHALLESGRRQVAETFQSSLGESLSDIDAHIRRAMDALRDGRDAATVLKDLQRSEKLIRRTRKAVKAQASLPTPSSAVTGGLAKSLRALCDEWRIAQPSGNLRVVCAVDDRNVPKSLWLSIQRIVHQALYGVASQAGAGTVSITVVPGDKALLLAIEHGGLEGEGVPATVVDSPGFVVMRELAEFSGGSFHADALPGGGMSVEVLWSRPSTFSQLVVVPSPVH